MTVRIPTVTRRPSTSPGVERLLAGFVPASVVATVEVVVAGRSERMIVCTNCGNHNEDTDEFCSWPCGKFLEWVGERVEAPAAAAEPEVEEEVDPVKVGFVDRVKAAVGIDKVG